MYFEYYLMGIILIPGILFSIYAQHKVNSTFNNFSKVYSKSNIVASDMLKRLLVATDLKNISVEQIGGTLSDHYDPKNQKICLSSSVYNSSSLASLGVACHEFGHALQKKEKYFPYQIRTILVPITNIASTILWPLVFIGLVLNFGVEAGGIVGNIFLWSGVGFFGIAVIFNLATLPVEFDASRRAIKVLRATNTMTEEELDDTKKVLDAAALTYVAALLVSILNLLRFVLVVFNRARRD